MPEMIKRRAGLVDQDGVHLVHDGEGVAALHQFLLVDSHVVAQIVEAHFVVGAVGDVGSVGLAARGVVHVVDNQTHAQAQEAVHLAHPLAVALGQIVVHGDDVHALAGQCVQIGGQGGHQGFTFTGFHLGDAALMQHNAADKLHGVRTHTQHAVGGFAHGGKGFGKQRIQALAILVALLELCGFGLELLVAQGFILVLHGQDLVHDRLNILEFALAVGSENFIKKSHVHHPFKGLYITGIIAYEL